MENYKVSVIVPSYKRHVNILSRCINSLLSQTYPNIEIVLVDDNARNDIKEYREEILKYIKELNNPKIKLIQNIDNLGGAGSRNEGFKQSTGDYITFLDDDDRYLPKKIENQLNFMLEQECDMSFTNLVLHNEDEKIVDSRDYTRIESFDNDYLLKYHIVYQITGTPTFMMKRDIFDKVKGFEIVSMGQEYYLMMKIIKTGCKIRYYNNCDVVAYRSDIEAISNSKSKISGEIKLFEFKKQHFNLLNFRQKQYVRCRHYAVMAVASKRNHLYFKMFYYLLLSVLSSPIDVVVEGFLLIKRNRRNKKNESIQ